MSRLQNWSAAFVRAGWVISFACALGAGRDESAKNVPVRAEQVDPDAADRTSPLEPDAVASDGVGGVAALDPGCEQIGAFQLPASGTSRYRGNAYTIDIATRLLEVKMELAFAGTTNLYVSVHQKQGDGTYDRYAGWPANDVIIANAVGGGAGNPQLYSTGHLPGAGVLLAPGDYAIGFAWSPSVSYGRNNVVYPQDFSRGQVQGLVSLNGVSLPVANDLGVLQPFTSGAYSMQLCFEPVPGACCYAAFGAIKCRDVSPTDCTAPDAFFHGERTTCAEVPCRFGACCDSCGKCLGDLTPETCTANGGTHWAAIGCPSDAQQLAQLCPKVLGACCTNAGECKALCVDECEAIAGSFNPNATCPSPTASGQPNICEGACCISEVGCIEKTRSDCIGLAGETAFRGEGTTCETTDCRGACCQISVTGQTCHPATARESCDYLAYQSGDPPQGDKAVFRGDATSCPIPVCIGGDRAGQACGTPPVCPSGMCNTAVCRPAQTGSCCLPNGTCINTVASTCGAGAGTFVLSGDCTASTCVIKPCCLPDGSCDFLTGPGCAAFGGAWKPTRTDCSASTCPDPTGACCGNASSECTVTSRASCTGIYRGNGTTCTTPATTCPGFGACCRPDGECLDDETMGYCDLINGTSRYQGDSSACNGPDVECDERGDCCTETNECLIILQSECEQLNPPGTFGIIGGSCIGSACNAPGACCRLSGICENNILAGNCSGPLNQHSPFNTCSNFGCQPRGACCVGSECREARTAAQCTAAGGIYDGNNTTCRENLCVLGACCDDSAGTCLAKSLQACEDSNGAYRGPATTCAGELCGRGACCQPDSNICEELVPHTSPPDEPGCLDISGASFSGVGVHCQADMCAVGACCLPNHTCNQTFTRQTCERQGGIYRGANSVCSTPNICNLCTQSIVSSIPANCAIDPRQPLDPSNPAARQVQIAFNCPASGLLTTDLQTSVQCGTEPSCQAAPVPTISTITPSGNTATIQFNAAMPTGGYTCIKHTASNTQTCIALLPGDINDNQSVSNGPITGDIITLRDHLAGTLPPPALPTHRCDIDRSGVCTPLDILTAIDLFNGADAFAAWKDQGLPPCPAP